MHLKKFSLIKGTTGWVLDPAYDLLNVAIILSDDTEELALTIEGKKTKPIAFHKLPKGIGFDRQANLRCL